MNRIIKELKDIYDTFQKAEFVFDDPTTEGQLYLCHHKLKQVIKTLEAREQFDNKEDKKIEKIGLPVPSLSPQILFLATKINEIIDKVNGEDNE